MSQETGFTSGSGKKLKVSKDSVQNKDYTKSVDGYSYYYKKKEQTPPLILTDLPTDTSNVTIDKIETFLKKLSEPRPKKEKKSYYPSNYYVKDESKKRKLE